MSAELQPDRGKRRRRRSRGARSFTRRRTLVPSLHGRAQAEAGVTAGRRVRAALTRSIAGVLAAICLAGGGAAEDRAADPPAGRIAVPWQPGNADGFLLGSRDEAGRRAARGVLWVKLVRPDGAGSVPFVVLLHGCGGLREPAMWSKWVEPWAGLFAAHGIGTAVVDSFGPRGVEQVCRSTVAVWARRRADDAYSVRAWLARQPYVDAGRIAVMGMSNGGRTVLSALRTDLHHTTPFHAAIALYPGCQSDETARFYAPLLILVGRADRVTPAAACERLRAAQPADSPVRLVVYPYAPHTFDMALRDRTILGMQLGYDREAAADARRQVMAFLAANGIGDGRAEP
jgi:dienelactone hydrolase